MKSIKKVNYHLAIPIWIGVFLLVTAIALIASACADPETDRNKNMSKQTEEKLVGQENSKDLPSEIFKAIIQQITDTNNQVNPEQIAVTEATIKTWSDGCLGLAKPDEVCIQVLVEGWLVEVSDGDRTWVYRTDNQGLNLRLESESN